MQTINELIGKLVVAKTLAKLKTYHPAILSTEIFLEELLGIKKHQKLPLKIEDENIYAIERTIDVKAYVKGIKIHFILGIPLIDSESYQYYKFFSLPQPIGNKIQILSIQNPYLAESDHRYISDIEECNEIQQKFYLCEKSSKSIDIHTPCEYRLLNHQYNGTGYFYKIEKEFEMIQQLTNNEWLLSVSKEERIIINCENKKEDRMIKGNFLVQISQGCMVTVKEEKMEAHTSKIEDRSFQIHSVELQKITEDVPHWKEQDIELEQITFTRLNETREELISLQEEIQAINTFKKLTSIGTPIILLCVLVIIISLCIMKRYWKRLKPIQPREESTEAEGLRHPWLQPST
nr:uncharacterized protein LOC111422946 [Onthophagus taurus]